MRIKLRKIGNSLGVILPKNVITSYKEGDIIQLEVITLENKVITSPKEAKEQVSKLKSEDPGKFDKNGKYITFFK